MSQGYQAYGAARELWSCKAEEVLIEGPAGTGKSRSALEKAHFCAMKYPGMRGLLIRKTRESMTESVLVTFETKVVPFGSPVLKGAQRRLRQAYSYPNGSSLVVGGLDKTTKIFSSEYDMILIFEGTELTEGEFEDLTTRLRNGIMPYQQAVVDCNPGPPTHWLNRRPNKPGSKMVRLLSRHEHNPLLFDPVTHAVTSAGEKYMAKLDNLSGNRKLRLRFGKWAAAEGMIFEDWDPNIHLIKRFPIPPSWKKFCSVDFGYNDPFVCQWWAVDDDGRMFMYREIYMTNRLVRDHAKQIRYYSRAEHIYDTVCDHDSENRMSLEEEGIFTTLAYKEIEPGLQAVIERIRIQGDGRPRLFILRDSRVELDTVLIDRAVPACTSEEFDGYIMKPVKDDKKLSEVPQDKDNHGMDAMRYAVCYQDGLLGTRFNTYVEEAAIVYPQEIETNTTAERSLTFEEPFFHEIL